jgi:hypothetical protein
LKNLLIAVLVFLGTVEVHAQTEKEVVNTLSKDLHDYALNGHEVYTVGWLGGITVKYFEDNPAGGAMVARTQADMNATDIVSVSTELQHGQESGYRLMLTGAYRVGPDSVQQKDLPLELAGTIPPAKLAEIVQAIRVLIADSAALKSFGARIHEYALDPDHNFMSVAPRYIHVTLSWHEEDGKIIPDVRGQTYYPDITEVTWKPGRSLPLDPQSDALNHDQSRKDAELLTLTTVEWVGNMTGNLFWGRDLTIELRPDTPKDVLDSMVTDLKRIAIFHGAHIADSVAAK